VTVQDHRIGRIGRRKKIRNVTQRILLMAAMLRQAILLAWLVTRPPRLCFPGIRW
jgi:hypothetical protein